MWNGIMRALIAALAMAGLVVSVLALRVHNMDPGAEPPCVVNAQWDCGTVNHSKYAVFPPLKFEEAPGRVHIPVAAIGIAGYALMVLAAAFGRWWIMLQLAEIGFAAASFLSYLEAFVIQKWCIYCVWSQAIVTVILLATVIALLVRRRAVEA